MGRPRKHPPRYYIATDTGVAVDADGVPHHFTKGELLPEGHPRLKFCRSYFEPVKEDYVISHGEVEQATAAPGERRGDKR
jgi:hypothetical protein